MKKLFAISVAMVFALVCIGTVFAASKSAYKAGDDVFVCNCGEKCPCLTMSKTAGKCTCGKDMVQTKIDKVEKGKAYVTVDGKERVFKTTGKYVCACGPKCPCKTISQTKGNCTCGKPMKTAKAKM